MGINIPMAIKKKLIENHPFFVLVAENDIDVLVGLLGEVIVEKDEFIVKENDVIDYIYIIVDGGVEVTRTIETVEGHISILLAKLGVGDIIGLSDVGFFSRTTLRTATVRALTNVTLLRVDVIEFSMFMLNLSVPYLNLSTSADQMIKANFIKKLNLNWNNKIIFDHLVQLCDVIESIKMESNQIVFRSGERDANVYLLISGKVNTVDAEGRILGVVKSGQVFGGSGVLDFPVQTVSAVVAENSSILKLSKENMIEKIQVEISENTHSLDESHVLRKADDIDSYKRISEDSQIIYILMDKNKKHMFLNSTGWAVWEFIDNKNSIDLIIQRVRERFNQINKEEVSYFINTLADKNLIT